MHILELGVVIRTAAGPDETEEEIYSTIVSLLRQEDHRWVEPPGVWRACVVEAVRGLREVARLGGAEGASGHAADCPQGGPPREGEVCCDVAQRRWHLQMRRLGGGPASDTDRRGWNEGWGELRKVLCPRCRTTYKPGERHGCAARVTRMLDPHTGQEYSTTVEGEYPQPGEKVDVNWAVHRIRELEQQARDIRIEALQQAMRALERCTHLGVTDGPSLRRELLAMAALAGGSLEERT